MVSRCFKRNMRYEGQCPLLDAIGSIFAGEKLAIPRYSQFFVCLKLGYLEKASLLCMVAGHVPELIVL
jgi:hypothetical protein